MSKDEYEKKIIEKHREELRFDAQINKSAKFSDIDSQKLKEFLKQAKNERGLDIPVNTPPKETLMRLNLMKGNKLTNSCRSSLWQRTTKFLYPGRSEMCEI